MPLESPAAVLYNEDGETLAVSGGVAVPAGTSALLFAGMTTTGTASIAKMTSDGTLYVTGTIIATPAALQNVYLTNILTSSVNNAQVINQGLSGSIAQSWYVSLTDGTKVIGKDSSAPVWVTGSFVANANVVFPATQSVQIIGPVTQSISGSAVLVREFPNYTSNLTIFTASLTSSIFVSLDTNAIGAIIYNNSNNNLFLGFGNQAATPDVFTVRLNKNAYYEVPDWYAGPITGVWAVSSSGTANVTLISP